MLSCGYYYIGCKSYIAEYLAPIFADYSYYSEPFCGSFSCGFELAEISSIPKLILSDIDPEVINFWRVVRDFPDDLTVCIFNHLGIIKDQLYRTNDSIGFDDYLNQYQTNSILDRAAIHWIGKHMNKGKRCTSFTTKMLPAICKTLEYLPNYEIALQARSSILESAIIGASSYNKHHITLDSTLMYVDPPYYNTPNYAYYNAYSKKFDHSALAKYLRYDLDSDWVLSYDYTPEVAELYSFANLVKIQVPNNFLGSYVPEYLILPYGVFDKLLSLHIITKQDGIYVA